jgi:hypothetical protein
MGGRYAAVTGAGTNWAVFSWVDHAVQRDYHPCPGTGCRSDGNGFFDDLQGILQGIAIAAATISLLTLKLIYMLST